MIGDRLRRLPTSMIPGAPRPLVVAGNGTFSFLPYDFSDHDERKPTRHEPHYGFSRTIRPKMTDNARNEGGKRNRQGR